MAEQRGRSETDQPSGLRRPWSRSERPLPRLVLRPLQDFLHTEASSGILLVLAAVVALAWANLAAGSYDRVWHTRLTVGLGRWMIEEDLRHWINDAAMALFFFVVGLEIKRELISGELRDPRALVLPALAALGGMLVPALVFLAINPGDVASRGWAIPMATDIAFAVGVLSVVGRGSPPGLKLFLLTFAIIDDIGAILVIAVFYAGSISFVALGIAAALLVVMIVFRRMNVRAGAVYLILGIGVWLAVFESGVHATIAGVLLAFVTPAVAFQRPRAVTEEARRVADETSDHPAPADSDAHHWLHLARLSRETVSPLVRLEEALHPWTSYVIVPLFALANAGVRITGDGFQSPTSLRVGFGVVVGLVLGKVMGVSLGAFVATRLGAHLPTGVVWRQMIGVAAIGGIGFTVSLFIANLAYTDETLLHAAKLGILVGSLISGIAGSVLIARAHR